MERSISPKPRKARQVKGEVKSTAIVSFDNEGTVHKEFVTEAKRSIAQTTITFYGDRLNTCEDFARNLGDKRSGFA
jgi:hypothetical protein